MSGSRDSTVTLATRRRTGSAVAPQPAVPCQRSSRASPACAAFRPQWRLHALHLLCPKSPRRRTERPAQLYRTPQHPTRFSSRAYLHQSPDELCSIVKFSGFFGWNNDSVPTYMANDGLEHDTADGGACLG